MLKKILTFFYNREETFLSLPALSVYWVLLSTFALAPYIFLKQFIAPGADTIAYFYPAFYWFSKNLEEGTSFLWDPHILSGFPLYLTQIGGFLDPLNITLYSVLPFALAYHVRLVIDFTLVMLFSYLVARKWEISRLAAFCIGPAYLMAFHWWYLSTPTLPNSLFVMPFVFWIYMQTRDAVSSRQFWSWTIVGGFGVGFAFLGGYAQFIFYSMFFVGLYFLYDFFYILERTRRSIRTFVEFSASLVTIGVIALIIGSPVILPSLEFVPYTIRAGGVSYEESQIKVLNSREPVYFFFPDYLRFPFINGGKKSLFVGVMFVLLAIIAMAHFRRNKLVPILSGIFLLSVFLALPGSILYWVLHHMPGFELFRYPHRFLYNGIWMLAVVGALGMDMIGAGLMNKRTRIISWFGLVLAAGLSAFVVACTLFGSWFWTPVKNAVSLLFEHLVYNPVSFPKGMAHYQGAIERGIDAWRELASLTTMPFAIPFVSLVFACLILAARVHGHISTRWFRVAAATLILATFMGVFVARWPDSISHEKVIGASQITASMLPVNDRLMYRAHAFHTGNSFVPRESSLIWRNGDVLAAIELQHATQVPNTNRYSGLLAADGYEPFISPDLLYVMSVYFTSNVTSQDLLMGVGMEDRKKIFTSHLDLLGMMAGKYVISGVPLEDTDLRFIRQATASPYNSPYYLYENRKAQPRVRLAGDVEAIPHSTIRELVEKKKSFEETAYLDCVECETQVNTTGALLRISRMENGYFDITVEASTSQWLIVAEQLLPGWKVTLDGKGVAPIRANGMYMAIQIPEGTHRAVFEYEGLFGEARILRLLGLHPHYSLEQP